ncbi:MAG: hypothetical protein U0I48_01365 [Acutalibacteraceae bacterium]|nr:hypothetical protein [Acutalibacteraceae bacterium]
MKNKATVYLITTPTSIELGKPVKVTLFDPRELKSYNSSELFVEEKTVELPDGYSIKKTESEELGIFEGDVFCGLSVSGRGILVDSSTLSRDRRIVLSFI